MSEQPNNITTEDFCTPGRELEEAGGLSGVSELEGVALNTPYKLIRKGGNRRECAKSGK